jgi:hypothetical protein
MPGGCVTKIGRTYKKMDIYSKETKHTTDEKAACTSHERQHISQKQHISQNNTSHEKQHISQTA